MQLVLKNGEIKEVDTTHIFDNQYNTTDGERIMDTEVKYIIDDIRLGEFYCSSVKQGTYDEVTKAIAEKRAQINKCEGCFWFNRHTRIEDECESQTIIEGNKKICIEKRVYELSCSYDHADGKCVNDIDDTPRLFRDVNECFFCEYPQGLPDMKPLKEFMVANAERYGIVPYWNDQALSIDNSFKHRKPFGSYVFEASRHCDCFTLANARNSFAFYVDFDHRCFIIRKYDTYKVREYFGVTKYDWESKTSSYEPITNYDKFATWFWQIVDDFNATK